LKAQRERSRVHLHSRHSRPLASVKNHGGAQLVAAESAHLVECLMADRPMLAVECLTVLAVIDVRVMQVPL
jgi:hypothetical protein